MILKGRYNDNNLQEFAESIKEIQLQIGFRVSARGWAYLMEQKRLINKDEFDKVNNLINKCRKKGFLSIDFVAEESSRQFQGVEFPADYSVIRDFGTWLSGSLNTAEHYNVDWWEDEKYYIQMVVEKIDLVTLFDPVCRKYHIPIANAKGWSSMLQRAEYARRFKEAENQGMECVLLYCGDFDPDGLRITEFMHKNLYDVSNIVWNDYTSGYDPSNLIIERFGLNYDFIEDHNLTWIDNLITGSKKNLADPNHKNYHMPYLQDYLRRYGERKCEANAIVTMPKEAANLVEKTIISYLGDDALDRFEVKRQKIRDEFDEYMDSNPIGEAINDAIEHIENNY